MTEKGESPVYFIYITKKLKREKTCLNKGEPSSKAKYYKFSDSE